MLDTKQQKEELAMFFSGPYDKNNVIITIYSGAGGTDAQDWAGMLLRMYERYAMIKGYKVALLSQSLGEEKGIKEATLEIEAKYAYGYLKNENGVHRLVRISPYSAQKLRHTSFALVEVLPQLSKESAAQANIRPEDIEVQTFRSSGPGGQYVNKTESAVRIKHLPTGVVVACQSERLQGQNREKAMKLLASKLVIKYAKDKKEKLDKIRGGFVPAEWGHQIRSYVLHPYKMVKDHRTNVKTSDAKKVLDGDLDEFIEAEVKMR
jgi:peptide chain release factor 2